MKLSLPTLQNSSLLRRILPALLVCSFVICFASVTHADEPAVGTNGGVSTGTLMAAALETAGYAAQSKILAELKAMLVSLGALITLVCIISAVFTSALHGNFSSVKWLLIGPPVFFYLIQSSASSASGVEWQFGAFRDAGERTQLLRNANVQSAGNTKVSSFFHTYNRLISGIVQSSVSLLTNRAVTSQMLFMTRQRILDELFSMEIADARLLALVRFTMSNCGAEMEAARRVAMGMRHPTYRATPEYGAAVALYCREMDSPKPGLSAETAEYVATAVMTAQAAEHGGSFRAPRIRELMQQTTCSNLWRWGHAAVRANALALQAQINAQAIQQQAMANDANILSRISNDIFTKITTARAHLDSAGNQVPPVCPGVANDRVSVSTAQAALPIVFTGWMIRKLYTSDPRGQMISTLFQHAGVESQPLNYGEFRGMEAQQAVNRRTRNQRLAESAKWEAYTLAMLLPYLQGAGLFVLATSFPFFALMALIPGRAGSFLQWCALWAWLKSWDVGWALVMILDEALWSMLPHTTYYTIQSSTIGQRNNYVMDTNPVTVFEAAFEGDYSYSLSTYYLLLGGMLSAVPVISAHAIIGSKKAVAGVMLNGLKTVGQNFGKFAGDWVSTEQTSVTDQAREMSTFIMAAQGLNNIHAEAVRTTAGGNPTLAVMAGMTPAPQMAAALAEAGVTRRLAQQQQAANAPMAPVNPGFANQNQNNPAGGNPPGPVAGGGATGITSPAPRSQAHVAAVNSDLESLQPELRWNASGGQGQVVSPLNRVMSELIRSGNTGAGGQGSGPSLLQMLANPSFVNPLGWRNMDNPIFSPAQQRNAAITHNMPDLMPPTLNLAPTVELRAYGTRIAEIYRAGEIARSWGSEGMLASGYLLSAAGASRLLGARFTGPVGNAMQHYLAGRAAGDADRMHITGIEMQRLANAHMANYMHLCAQELLYQAGQSEGVLGAESARAGVSTRGEHWNIIRWDNNNFGNTNVSMQRLDLEFLRLRGQAQVNPYMNLIPPPTLMGGGNR